MDDETAIAEINAMASRLDSDDDENISSEELRAAMDSGQYSEEEKAAIQYLFDNKGSFGKKLDAQDGDQDGFIALTTLSEGVPDSEGSSEGSTMDEETAVATLDDISSLLDGQITGQAADGMIGYEELEAALADKTDKYTEEQKAAIQYLLDNQDFLGELDAADGSQDAFIEVGTLSEGVPDSGSTSEGSTMDAETAVDTLDEISFELDTQLYGTYDNKISYDELEAALADETIKYTEEQKAAIQYLLDNEDLLGELDAADGTSDELIAVGTLSEGVPDSAGSSEGSLSEEDKAVLDQLELNVALAVDDNGDQAITIDELEAAVANPGSYYSAESIAAFQYLIDNKNGLGSRLDEVDGDADNSFKIDSIDKLGAPTWVSEDSTSAAATPEQPLDDTTVANRIQLIAGSLDTQRDGGEADGTISMDDLQSALADETDKYSEEDKAAIRYLIDNQNGLRSRLDGFDGSGDSLIQVETLNKVVADPDIKAEEVKMSNRKALVTLRIWMDANSRDGITMEDLMNLSEDTNVSEETRNAAKLLYKDVHLFKTCDDGKMGDMNYDGVASKEDIDKVIKKAELDTLGNGGYVISEAGDTVIQSGGTGGTFGGSGTVPPLSGPPASTGDPALDYLNWLNYSAIYPSVDTYNQHVK